MDVLQKTIERDETTYYLYVNYGPVFHKNTGEYLNHAYTISYVSEKGILLKVKHKNKEKAVQLTIQELQKL